MRLLAATALAIALIAPTAAAAAPLFRFGRSGGNIRPYTVTIAADGMVTATGSARVTARMLSQPALRGLLVLARAEGFSRLPGRIACPGTHPDVASLFVSVGTRLVTVHGGCSAPFAELFAVLEATTGAGG